jgi:hypothetical protein
MTTNNLNLYNIYRFATKSDKVYQLLALCLWFSSGIPASFTTKTGRHDIGERMLKLALNTMNTIKLSVILLTIKIL